VQERGNASQAMNDVLPGTITKDRLLSQQTTASMHVNSESVSNCLFSRCIRSFWAKILI
jgi:hypothetical protein